MQVADDEQRLARSLRVALEAEGLAVDLAHDGTDGPWPATENEYDAIVLDLMLGAPHSARSRPGRLPATAGRRSLGAARGNR